MPFGIHLRISTNLICKFKTCFVNQVFGNYSFLQKKICLYIVAKLYFLLMAEDQTDLEILSEKEKGQKFDLDFWSLKFTGQYKEFEKSFLVSYFNNSLNKVRLAILSAIIFYALFGILDAAYIPDFKYKLWTIRYLIVIPVLIAILSLSFKRIFKRKIQFISSMVVFLSGLSVIVIIWLAPPFLSNYYFPGLVLILFMNYGFMKLRFVWASFVGVSITTLYIIFAFEIIQMPYLLCVFNSFFLIAINVVGIFISREFEIYARKEYFSNQLLKIEQMKLKTLNVRLEAKIKDKALQFTQLQKDILNDDENNK